MTTSRDTGTQHKLRMPPELKEKLFESAKDMNRSLNAEIVARLEESFDNQVKEAGVSFIISAYFMGLISRYENEKELFGHLIAKSTDDSEINNFKVEINRCDILIAELNELIEQIKPKKVSH